MLPVVLDRPAVRLEKEDRADDKEYERYSYHEQDDEEEKEENKTHNPLPACCGGKWRDETATTACVLLRSAI